MNKSNETYVFCSQCDLITSNFLEWADEFWCEEKCVSYLPTESFKPDLINDFIDEGLDFDSEMSTVGDWVIAW
jgi:hypothetical protein